MIRLRLWIGAFIAAVAGLAIWGRAQREKGRADTEVDVLKDTHKRMEAGREAANDLRGADRAARIEQLLRNNGHW